MRRFIFASHHKLAYGLKDTVDFLTGATKTIYDINAYLDDETKEIAKEIVRCNALDRVYMALDYFDASINRISAWVVGMRSWQKALLNAMLMPNEALKKLQNESRFTELMAIQEELKTMPFGDIWKEYCRRCGVDEDITWFTKVTEYENQVLSKRN